MNDHRDSAAGLGEPPEVPLRVSLTIRQWIGLPLIAAIPLLAILGLFGERAADVTAHSASLSVRVTYPVRFRYRQVQQLRVTVRNNSPATLDTVLVSFDTAYISRFSNVRFDPSPIAAFVVPIRRLAPGAVGDAFAEVYGEQYGRNRGRIVVTTRGDSVVIPVSTFVFP